LFLDEIADMAPTCQAALLHALPDDDLAAHGHALRARLISTTGRAPLELEDVLQRGILRKHLFYRINGVSLRLSLLIELKDDFPALVELLLKKSSSLLSNPLASLRQYY